MKQNNRKVRYIRQHDEKDCGAACLSMIADYYKFKVPLAKFRELVKVDNEGTSIFGVIDGASKIGMKADALQGSISEFVDGVRNNELNLPAIAHIVTERGFFHYVVVYKIKNDMIYLCDPDNGYVKQRIEDFQKKFTGNVINIVPSDDFKECKQSSRIFYDLLLKQLSHKKLIYMIVLVSMLINVVNIASSYIFKFIIDGTSQRADEHVYMKIYKYGIIVILMFVIQSLLQYMRSVWEAKISKNMDIDIFLKTYNSAVKLPVNFFTTRKTGEVMSRFSDAENIRNAISGIVMSLFVDVIMVLFFLYMMIRTSIALTVISVGIMLIYACIIYGFKNKIKNSKHSVMENNAIVSSFLKESVDGIETIKSYAQEERCIEKMSEMYYKQADSIFKATLVFSLQSTLSGFLSSFGTIALLMVGVYSSQKGIITVGQIMTFYVMFSYFTTPVQNLISFQPTIQTAFVAVDRLDDILETTPEDISGSEKKLDSIRKISFENVVFGYGNRQPVLRGISLEAERGNTIAIVGESGCGKTTLAKILMRFYDHQDGSVTINDEEINCYPVDEIRKRIAYISQDTFLFSDTIRNNLTTGCDDVSDAEILEACHLSHADEFIRKMPGGIDTLIGENSCDLSGGQKQRLAIARALIKKPDVLIMDEATSNLDSVSESVIQEMLNDVKKDMICIVIAHRLKTIRNSDKIFFIQDGCVVESGSHDELMKLENGLYQKYYKCS